MAAEPLTSPKIVGKARPRVDGPLKVTGRAMYSSDHHFPGILYAVPVSATIADGKIEKFDTAAAEQMPGVRAIYHRENIGKLFRVSVSFGDLSMIDETRPPFEDGVIRYYGQYVALAVGETIEQAGAAADAVKVTYKREKPNSNQCSAWSVSPAFAKREVPNRRIWNPPRSRASAESQSPPLKKRR